METDSEKVVNLEDSLIARIESLGPIWWHKSFGWMCFHTEKRKFFGGYKVIDNNILDLLLRLSPEDFPKALEQGFVKFDFGKTWVETEVTSEEELNRFFPFIQSAYNFVKK